MKESLSTQYNAVADSYSEINRKMNEKSNKAFKKILDLIIPSIKSVVDFGCGPGDLFPYFLDRGIECFGIDSSDEMVKIAKSQMVEVCKGDFTNTPFPPKSFDLICSKWALQTTPYIDPVYKECDRLLKPGGYIAFLMVHPFRQFLEKKRLGKDYFEKEIVDSIIFDGAITVQEPTHTMQEYLSDYFLEHFSLLKIVEEDEFPAAEQINGDIYPTYLIILAQKK